MSDDEVPSRENTPERRGSLTREELRSAILAWLESERGRYLELSTSIGVPPAVPFAETVASNVTESGATYSERVRSISSLSLASNAGMLIFLAEHKQGGPTQPPDVVHDYFGDRCRVWGFPPFNDGLERDDAASRLSARGMLRVVAGQYLAQLNSLDQPDAALAATSVDGLLQLLEEDHILLVESLPLAGLRLKTESLEFGGFTIRTLTNEELGRRAGSVRLSPNRHELALPLLSATDSSSRHALVVRTPSSKLKQPTEYRMHKAVLAFQLLGFQPYGRGDTSIYTEPGPSSLQMGTVVQLPRNGLIRDVTLDDLKSVVEMAARLPDDAFSKPTSKKAIALHRFRSAMSEQYPGDALIDYVIALEAVFLAGDAELSFRLAVYGAHYLEPDRGERRKVYDDLREIYKVRSHLVHGSKGWGDHEGLETLRVKARDVTRRILLKALLDGWPTATQLEDLTFS